MGNPFTISFGEEPQYMIDRPLLMDEVLRKFEDEPPSNRTYMITGVRGSGKTVFMSAISNYFRQQKDWIVVDLNPVGNMLKQLASRLYNNDSIIDIFKKAKINLSAWGISAEFEKSDPITDLETGVVRMITQLQRKNKKILITIDEAVKNDQIQEFAYAFQSMARLKLPIRLLMTGLPENIDVLQNIETLTFLYRAPKIHMTPLDIGYIAHVYQSEFNFKNRDEAVRIAKLTKGYPYAFQVLGHYTYENCGNHFAAIPKTKLYLNENVYSKIWSELSENDKNILYAAVKLDTDSVTEIREYLKMESNEFGQYKRRLLRKGIITQPSYGKIALTLPFFDEYIIENTLFFD